MMFDLAMYVIEDVQDAAKAEHHEIYAFNIDDAECANCGMVVGPSKSEFFPCVIVVSTKMDDAWPICLDCASPLLYPREWIIELEI